MVVSNLTRLTPQPLPYLNHGAASSVWPLPLAKFWRRDMPPPFREKIAEPWTDGPTVRRPPTGKCSQSMDIVHESRSCVAAHGGYPEGPAFFGTQAASLELGNVYAHVAQRPMMKPVSGDSRRVHVRRQRTIQGSIAVIFSNHDLSIAVIFSNHDVQPKSQCDSFGPRL